MILQPGDPIIYMKVGMHAQEELEDILARKRQEIEREGFGMWGYGGNTCHPRSMVQPFARSAGKPIVLCMQPMESRHRAEPVRAEEYSVDGQRWEPIPSSINVLGSNFALCIRSLEQVNITMDLASTQVALGKSRGRSGSSYVRGRVDKACLEVLHEGGTEESKRIMIGAVAEIVDPFAVQVRS